MYAQAGTDTAAAVEQDSVQQLQQQPLLQSNEVPAEPPADAPGVTKLQITLAGSCMSIYAHYILHCMSQDGSEVLSANMYRCVDTVILHVHVSLELCTSVGVL
jgi:hypothetical protein